MVGGAHPCLIISRSAHSHSPISLMGSPNSSMDQWRSGKLDLCTIGNGQVFVLIELI